MLRSIRPDARKLSPLPAPKPEPVKCSRPYGIIYVAYGDKAKTACRAGLESAKARHPGIQVAVISDVPVPGADAKIVCPEMDIGAREYKTQVYQYSPFEYTLYLDADTLVVGSLQAGFSALEVGWDMVAALDFRPTVGLVDHLPPDDKQATLETVGTREYPHYNAGLIYFRKSPEVEEFYQLWHEEWLKFSYRDQGAFIRALHRSRVKLWTFAWQWNTHREIRAKHIFHNHHQVDRTWGRRRE